MTDDYDCDDDDNDNKDDDDDHDNDKTTNVMLLNLCNIHSSVFAV